MVITVKVGDVYYYEFLSETTGMEIRNEYEFIKIMGELAKKKKEYEEVGEALAAVKQRGIWCCDTDERRNCIRRTADCKTWK